MLLFIDDLQWADSGSLRLLSAVISSRRLAVARLVLVVGWRHTDLSASPAASQWLDTAHAVTVMGVTSIVLNSLDRDATRTMLSDLLQLAPSDASLQALHEVVHAKTNGVPFLLMQLLRLLVSSGTMRFDDSSSGAVIDIEGVKAQHFAADASSVLIPRLHGLPLGAQRVLAVAACVGMEFRCDLQANPPMPSHRLVVSSFVP